MAAITAPVGKGVSPSKGNFTADVSVVQSFLNNWIMLGQLNGWVNPLVIDGKIGDKTIEAIEFFQAWILGWKHPDGRIDPGGATVKALFGPLKLRPEVDPAFWKKPTVIPKLPKPVSYVAVELTTNEVVKLKSGGDTVIFDSVKGVDVRIRSGEVWQGPSGERLVLAGCWPT